MPVDDPQFVTGVATAALEVLEVPGGQQPETELAIVPLGAGSGAAGWVSVRDGLGAACEVWAVQSAQAPAGHDSWREGGVVQRDDTTVAEGLATGTGFASTRCVVTKLETQHLLVEPAAATALALAEQQRERIRGRRVVLVLTGANITLPQLRRLLEDRGG